MSTQQGQYTNEEFRTMWDTAGRRGGDPYTGWAWIAYGKDTTNYYTQHADGSWTNYDCKTS